MELFVVLYHSGMIQEHLYYKVDNFLGGIKHYSGYVCTSHVSSYHNTHHRNVVVSYYLTLVPQIFHRSIYSSVSCFLRSYNCNLDMSKCRKRTLTLHFVVFPFLYCRLLLAQFHHLAISLLQNLQPLDHSRHQHLNLHLYLY